MRWKTHPPRVHLPLPRRRKSLWHPPGDFHLVDAQLVNFGTVKSRRDKQASVLGPGGILIVLLRRRYVRFERIRCGQQRQRDADQAYEQAD